MQTVRSPCGVLANMFNERANCSLPSYIKKKGNTGMRMRILMSFKKFNDCQKDNPCAVSHTCRKQLQMIEPESNIWSWVSRTSGSRRNEWWKNELLKEHWPKSWMCSSHVVMVCYCCWNRQEESVKKRVGLSCSKNIWGREDERMLLSLLYCPGKSSRQNGMNPSHWTKYIDWNPNGKMIPALNNNLKFFLSATHACLWHPIKLVQTPVMLLHSLSD